MRARALREAACTPGQKVVILIRMRSGSA